MQSRRAPLSAAPVSQKLVASTTQKAAQTIQTYAANVEFMRTMILTHPRAYNDWLRTNLQFFGAVTFEVNGQSRKASFIDPTKLTVSSQYTAWPDTVPAGSGFWDVAGVDRTVLLGELLG